MVGFFGFGNLTRADCQDLIISEIMYNPSGADPKNEWIELYHNSPSNWILEKSSNNIKDFGVKVNFSSAGPNRVVYLEEIPIIYPKEYFLLTNNYDGPTFLDIKTKYNIKNDVKIFHSSFSLTNSNDDAKNSLKISCDTGITWQDTLNYSNTWGGNGNDKSLEKINIFSENDQTNWQESFDTFGNTPGRINSTKVEIPKIIYSSKISLNELLPNPEQSPEKNYEYVEIFNSGDEAVSLDGWKIKDKKSEFDLSGTISALSFALFYNTVSLNNSNETISLENPDGEVVSSISYTKIQSGASYNFDGKSWRWSRFLTPGAVNQFNNLPEAKIKYDKKIYKNVYADFKINVSDKDNDSLKITWDFGDGHKSYKKTTRHKYEKSGKYQVSVKVFDGSEEVIETFSIEVKNFSKKKNKIKIISVNPNPKGKDADLETISVINKSKRAVNLKGWSIATGSKKLYNHPIQTELIVKPKKTIKITRQDALFSLNNKESKIELRYPDGKVASKTSYNNKKGIKEDEYWEKVSSKWVLKNVPKLETKILAASENILPEETTIPLTVNSTEENLTSPIIILTKNHLPKIEIKLAFQKYNTFLKSFRLSDNEIKPKDSFYHFTKIKKIQRKHYALVFFGKLPSETNLLLTRLINSLES
ncbi:MAG: hypothetical protein COU40_01355 [Candidatus Moranbacteria bacterium CG10_big_fil_rev_8_21_14_0_10_35_21]|nr:MAG: hypothetical protein COU40_01355 [Candidatus Moranbacteria bacterium CG10_big_fil_rev_8_21_14_0_10_35_21]PJA88981.1 MAG: hypothetical protein CO139_00180 [Candidatus Moranbacteria bacterium CG_4_9_14_3_um_filter_36_9]